VTQLSPLELGLLRAVRLADEEEGGLSPEALTEDELEAAGRLAELGLIEWKSAYGEAPDGEEDEREAGDLEGVYRVTGSGVAVLHDHPQV
jgi:hypothetical protein